MKHLNNVQQTHEQHEKQLNNNETIETIENKLRNNT